MTPPLLAYSIVAHFQPRGHVVEPCAGGGSFLEALALSSGPDKVTSCEIDEGSDCYSLRGQQFDWLITNPPWSPHSDLAGNKRTLTDFLDLACSVSANIVLLIPLPNLMTRKRLATIDAHGFAFREIVLLDNPPNPWPQGGLQLAVTYLCQGYTGGTKWVQKIGSP